MYCVYKVENEINGKCYIGSCSTKSLARRKSQHLSSQSQNPKFEKDFRIYNKWDFFFEVLNEGFLTRLEAEKFEKIYIQVYNAYYGGYNCTIDGK